ncbi:MAG: hypothetical protein RIC16_03540 [Rhodospirillales bacterium]
MTSTDVAPDQIGDFYRHLNECIAANNHADWAGVYESSGACFDVATTGLAQKIELRHLSTLALCCAFAGRGREIVAMARAALNPDRETALRQLVNELIGTHNRGAPVASLIEAITVEQSVLLAIPEMIDVTVPVWNIARDRWNDPRRELLERMAALAGVKTRPPLPIWQDSQRRVYPELGCIFVHVPRTAGHSVAAGLFDAASVVSPPQDWVDIGDDLKRLEMHSTAAQIKSVIGETRWQSTRTFTIVRNPWDLMLSCYRYLTEYAPRQSDYLVAIAAQVRAIGDFNSFIDSPWGRERIVHLKADIEDWYTIDGKQAVDDVFRLEDLSDTWPRFVRDLGLSESVAALPHRGATSKSEDRHAAYSDKSRDIVGHRFKALIERFDYTF